MKYRIVRESDDNGIRAYELYLWEKNFFGFYGWRPVKEYGLRTSWTKRFKNIVEVKQHLKSLNIKREIIKEEEYHGS